jgi:alkylation response protein AidB-like acyl-CoA dehydrogenase
MQPEMGQEELDLILSTLAAFAKDRIPLETRLGWDRDETCPEALIRELLGPDVGVHLAFIPATHGGLGGGAKHIFRISEAVAAVDLGLATSLLGISLGTDPIRVGGTPEQQARWMTRVAQDGLVVAYAVTEPTAGSDLGAIKTKATPVIEGDETVAYVIDGTKQFITNGGIADLFTVLASTPAGPTFFVVEKGAEGLAAGPPEEKHGIRASNTTQLFLEGVRVPADNLIGGVEGRGLSQAKEVFGFTRVMVAAFGLGVGAEAVRRAIAYGKEREQGGSLLADKPGWTHKLVVPHATALEAARAHIEQVSGGLDATEEDLSVDGAIAKLSATEAGNAAAEAAIQAHGGYGYTHHYEVEKLKRDVRITCIYEGTSEICQRTIAQDRWRRHMTSKGRHYRDLAAELAALDNNGAGCGGAIAAAAAVALAGTMDAWRELKLTRHQHVQLTLGWLCARVEVAAAFARKVASGNADSSGQSIETLAAMSRLFARAAAREVIDTGTALTVGQGAFVGEGMRAFERTIGRDQVADLLAGTVADTDAVARALHAD